MPYVQGSAIEKAKNGGMEQKIELIHEHLRNKYGDSLTIVSTFEDKILAFQDGKPRSISFFINENSEMVITNNRYSKLIPVIEEDQVQMHVAQELRDITKDMLSGKDISRTRVRELMPFIKEGDMIWMSDVIRGINESTKPNTWSRMYEANTERIKTKLYGNIRELESGIPKTRYSRLPENRISEFEPEIQESISIINNCYKSVIDSCKNLNFCDNDFLGAACESLIDEAQALVGLLSKAEKLLRQEDLPRVAKAHDKLAERAKTMVLVSEYLKLKSEPNNKELTNDSKQNQNNA